MAKVTVLGGSGAVGSVAAKTLARLDYFSEVVIADINLDKAEAVAQQAGAKACAVKVDVLDKKNLADVLAGSDVVLNCVGPFYKFVRPVLETVIELGINYVDICDDVDVTIEIFEPEMNEKAKKAGIAALIGMGSSPGATNLLAKFAYDNLLDEVDSIDIFHAHGGEPFEGEGVIGHRFHCMSIDVPMFLDGRLTHVKFFEEDGIALRERFEFPVVGDVLLYPYPHPEQVTLPRYLKVNRVTNKGTVLPEPYYNLTRDLCGLGLADKNPVKVKGVEVTPYDFATAYIIRERERILKETNFGTQRGCASVIVKGKKDGKKNEYRFHMASQSQALGEGTGIPAAMGAILMITGKVAGKGTMPPEACINPAELIGLIPQVMDLDKKKEGGGKFGGVVVEHIDENGNMKKMDLG